jgi:hypothetical protein
LKNFTEKVDTRYNDDHFSSAVEWKKYYEVSCHIMLLPRHQNAGQSHDIKIANKCFENVAKFFYLETTITDQNLIQEEIKRRLNSGNACYHSVQNHFVFSFAV